MNGSWSLFLSSYPKRTQQIQLKLEREVEREKTMNGVMIFDDNMSHLSAASNEASISSSSRNELAAAGTLYPQQPFAVSPNQPPPAKKKRNLPGNPDPDAEVVALSPKTLITTNRFICEICKKGFQRDQNLQLHRRGHNLPWKLKQRSNKEVIKRKVYVCPETTCVHHDPSRALGDLTGIKKHFFRKHGEKKWKCEKCSKRYAVQSDWKAHSKICGTREYRCDCGTLFSRRDSFITHRAFCDALTEETARRSITLATTPNPLLSSSHHSFNLHHNFPLKREQEDVNQITFNSNITPHLPQWLANSNPGPCPGPGPGPNPMDLSTQLFSPPRLDLDHSSFNNVYNDLENPNNNPSSTPSSTPTLSPLPSFRPTPPPPPPPPPHMSATALLQKAAQMGVTISNSETILSRPHQHHMNNTAPTATAETGTGTRTGFSSAASLAASTAGTCLGFASREERGGSGFLTSGCMEQVGATLMSSSLPCGSGFEGSFEEALMNGMLNPKMGGGGGADHGLTRDFLGLRAFSFPNMAEFDQMNSSSSYEKLNQNQTPWQG